MTATIISDPGGVAYGTPPGCNGLSHRYRWWRACGAYHRLPYATPPGVNPARAIGLECGDRSNRRFHSVQRELRLTRVKARSA
jgi:hypothetical protein